MAGEMKHGGGYFLGLAACLLVALYFLATTFYALANFDQFASATPQFVRYVLAPAFLGLGFLSIGLFAKPRWSKPAGIYGLSLLMGLFFFETYLAARHLSVHFASLGRLDEDQHAMVEREDDFVRGFTLRSLNNLAGVDELRETMLAGFPGSTTLLCSPPGQVITYTADRYGFNNPDAIYDAPIDLMLLGDSFVEGFCLEPGQDLASRLRQSGPNTASMGIRGNGPLIELATLGRYGPMLKPRHVVMTFFEGNDWENLERSLGFPWLRAALRRGVPFGTPSDAAPTVEKARHLVDAYDDEDVTITDLVAQGSFLRNFAALQMTSTSLGLLYPKISEEIPEFQQALRRAKELTQGWGGCFSLLYIPRIDRYVGVFPSDVGFDHLRMLVLDAAEAEGVDVIDLTGIFRTHPEPARMYAPDAHFSQEGAIVAANAVAQSLGEAAAADDGCEPLAMDEDPRPEANVSRRGERQRYGG